MGSGEQPKLQRVMFERARERESARESRASVAMIIKDTYVNSSGRQEQLWVVTKTKSADGATIRSVAHHADCIDLQRGQYNLELFGCSGTSTQVYVFNADGTISSLSTQGGQKEGEVVAVC